MKFKLGDRVKTIGGTHPGTITRLPGKESHGYGIDFDHLDDPTWALEWELMFVEDPNLTRDPFQISDVVVIRGTGTSLDGSVAQVHGVRKGGCDVLVIGRPTSFVIDNTELELLASQQNVEATTR